MPGTKVDQSEVRQLVDKFKSDGAFDKLRHKIFASIISSDRFKNVASRTEAIVDDLLKTVTPDFTKNKARALLRERLSSEHSSEYAVMISQGLEADETLHSLLEEIGHYVDSFVGIAEQEVVQNSQLQHCDANHEVCDMEIDSDSEPNSRTNVTKEISVSEIALPPYTCDDHLFKKPYPIRPVSRNIRGMSLNTPFLKQQNQVNVGSNFPFKGPVDAWSGSTSVTLQNQRTLANRYLNSKDAMLTKYYMTSLTDFHARRRHTAYNGNLPSYR
ncbi:unnamed protein product [Thelazia callipaeda]|uniref:DEK_C domain-containing protein n=1 Tax=Thelazia callipaeda TaxID=103827 RepID=A0A0N5CL36_THECL|nr:unnamed protein product [Thelazia callipaeda]